MPLYIFTLKTVFDTYEQEREKLFTIMKMHTFI